ncbi:hypothetical protein BFJ69_g15442 [Fusarium oxysporum]|uniref:Uncharacterized protein n=1 Tax=Fusarium oxysporum TaxID=5507 RepID=A0A420ME84_FUSOX|nr:hypothetical protein BFJ69_g15442 [Fusarium oxysporum]
MAMSAARTFIGEAVRFAFQGSKIDCNSPAVPEKGQWSGSGTMADHFQAILACVGMSGLTYVPAIWKSGHYSYHGLFDSS